MPTATALLVASLAALVAIAGLATGDARPRNVPPMRQEYLGPEGYRALQAEWKRWTDEHPRDGAAFTQLARAANYAGAPCADVLRWARRGVELAPRSAEALVTLGRFNENSWCEGGGADPSQSVRLLEQALEIDPGTDEAHYHLWVMRLAQGRKEDADRHLAALLDHGRMPEPLVDFGWNLLVGLEPDAILITNGDNDTYPTVALQSVRGFRRDVVVVNLGLLELDWHRRALASGPRAIPIPELPGESDVAQRALSAMLERLEREGSRRPVYMAVTVQKDRFAPGRQLSLEGIVYRVNSARGGSVTDEKRLEENLERRYRRESATSPSVNWERWSALQPLVRNYMAADWQLASAHFRRGRRAEGRAVMERILALCEFQKIDDGGRIMVKGWQGLDPRAPRLAHWRSRFAS